MTERASSRARRALAPALLALVFASFTACETVRVKPQAQPLPDVPSAGQFPHERFGLILEKVVSADGLVDYGKLQLDQEILDEYLAEVARVSPDSHVHLFPTEEDRLAYWINAHNACALRAVLKWNRPADLSRVGSRFDKTEFVVGRRSMSLDEIRDHIRKRFQDPRVHFVLVRGRRGGPPLAKAPFETATLDAQLNAAARAFLSSERHVQWKPPSTEARLNRVILDFRTDFENHTPATVSGDARLVAALNRWREPRAYIVAATLTPIGTDERLNDVSNQ